MGVEPDPTRQTKNPNPQTAAKQNMCEQVDALAGLIKILQMNKPKLGHAIF